MEGECVRGETNRKNEPKPKCNDDWRLRMDTPWALLCVALFLVTLGVHYRALCNDRTDLLLPELMETMESQCRSLGTAFEQNVPESLLLHPVETQFGIAVWVENETWALPVHEALDRIEKVVEDGLAAASAVNSNNNNNDNTNTNNDNNDMNHGEKFIQRIVRVASSPHHPHTTGHVGDSNSKNHNRNSNNNNNNNNNNNRVEDKDALAAAAATQQLGLGVAKHAYALDLREELKMHGVSFFLSSSQQTDSTVRCFAFADRQAYCLVPANTTTALLQREITAAIATLMSNWMNLRSFRDLNIVQQWVMDRQVRGCQYGLRALRQLQLSVNEHPEMPAPYGVRETVRRLQRLIDARMFAQFARAADDLQFHPLLLPQVYIPWDQALVNHLSILLPVMGVGILGVRLTVAAHRRKRKGAGIQPETTVDEKKNQ